MLVRSRQYDDVASGQIVGRGGDQTVSLATGDGPGPAMKPYFAGGAAVERNRPDRLAIQLGFQRDDAPPREGIPPLEPLVLPKRLEDQDHFRIGPLHEGEQRAVNQVVTIRLISVQRAGQ